MRSSPSTPAHSLRADELGKTARSLIARLPLVTVPRLDDLPLALRKAVT